MMKLKIQNTSKLIASVCVVILMFFAMPLHGEIGAAFLDIGFGARPVGMGGAFTAISDDANSIFWNPAGLSKIEKSQLTVMHTKQFGMVPYSLGAYVSHYKSHYFGAAFLSSGDEVLKENTFLMSYARSFEIPVIGLTRVGSNLKIRNSSFGDNKDGGEDRSQGTAFGYGLDLGLMWKVGKKSNFGIFYRDMLNNVSYDNTTRKDKYMENVPATLIFGLSRKANPYFLFALDWEKSLHSDVPEKVHIGGEFSLMDMFYFRGGLWQNIDAYLNRNYSIGLGCRLTKARFSGQMDFSYVMNDLANTPRFSISIFH